MFTGTFLYSSNAFVHFLGFLPLGSGSGSESVHADPDPGGKTLSGSETLVRIVLIFKLKMLCNKGKWMMMMFGQILIESADSLRLRPALLFLKL